MVRLRSKMWNTWTEEKSASTERDRRAPGPVTIVANMGRDWARGLQSNRRSTDDGQGTNVVRIHGMQCEGKHVVPRSVRIRLNRYQHPCRTARTPERKDTTIDRGGPTDRDNAPRCFQDRRLKRDFLLYNGVGVYKSIKRDKTSTYNQRIVRRHAMR